MSSMFLYKIQTFRAFVEKIFSLLIVKLGRLYEESGQTNKFIGPNGQWAKIQLTPWTFKITLPVPIDGIICRIIRVILNISMAFHIGFSLQENARFSGWLIFTNSDSALVILFLWALIHNRFNVKAFGYCYDLNIGIPDLHNKASKR